VSVFLAQNLGPADEKVFGRKSQCAVSVFLAQNLGPADEKVFGPLFTQQGLPHTR